MMFLDAFDRMDSECYVSQDLLRSAVEGMWPFEVKEGTCYVDFDIDLNEYRIAVNIDTVAGIRYTHVERASASAMIHDQKRETARVCELTTRAFRRREDCSVPSNIVLGEE